MKTPKEISIGDVFEMSFKRSTKTVIVTNISNLYRSNKFAWKILSSAIDGSTFYTTKSRTLDYSGLKFVRKGTKSELKKGLKTVEEVLGRNDKSANEGYENIKKLNVKEGDTILINGSDCDWEGTVAKVLYDKVQILRKQRSQTSLTIDGVFFNFGSKPKRQKTVRSIWGQHIIKVVK